MKILLEDYKAKLKEITKPVNYKRRYCDFEVLRKKESEYSSFIKDIEKMIERNEKPGITISFKERLFNDFIPRIEDMIEKQKLHLHHLIDIGAPLDFVQSEQETQFHLMNKVKEYKEYAKHL